MRSTISVIFLIFGVVSTRAVKTQPTVSKGILIVFIYFNVIYFNVLNDGWLLLLLGVECPIGSKCSDVYKFWRGFNDTFSTRRGRVLVSNISSSSLSLVFVEWTCIFTTSKWKVAREVTHVRLQLDFSSCSSRSWLWLIDALNCSFSEAYPTVRRPHIPSSPV